jgi:c-di-GMP-related signal transduction protein
VPVGQLTALASLAQLRAGPAEIEELEEVINRDLGLSLKLLRYINSAFFGIRNDITSIRQAVMMLGARGVTRWAMLVTLTGGPSAPPELSMLALTRARMSERRCAGPRASSKRPANHQAGLNRNGPPRRAAPGRREVCGPDGARPGER